ncbi:MAG TPA: N-acetyltransferase [Desulfobacterales bacterium]|nr:N-acetyltransferase [Desulfobacterales bacterium]HIP38879.1 N-acetyltransferase [Desulfocapsa sulfexigens]
MSSSKLLLELKKSAGTVPELVLPLGNPVEALLRPIATDVDKINKTDVRLLSEWRNRFVKSFLTEFHSHDERTTSWLVQSVAEDPGKIMFMIDTLDGISIGHVGLGFINWQTGYVEADAIVRGRNARKGLMKEALQLLLRWADASLGLNDAWVRVRSDNSAVMFYQKVGFVEQKRIPLSKRISNDSCIWFEDNDAEENAPALVYMKYMHS